MVHVCGAVEETGEKEGAGRGLLSVCGRVGAWPAGAICACAWERGAGEEKRNGGRGGWVLVGFFILSSRPFTV